MSDLAFFAFKLLMSASLVGEAFGLFVSTPGAINDPVFIGISALLLFFAALPWVNLAAPNRGVGLTGVFISLGVAIFAARAAFGFVQFPRHCTGSGVVFCELENLLFATGGEYLAASPLALLAAVLFAGSIRILARARLTL